MTAPQDQYDALYDLWQVYLHMRAWGRPEYAGLSEKAREEFTELVETRALFTYVEDCKRDLLRAGVEVPDAWLNVLFAAHLTAGEPLPQAEADRLGVILAEMYPMLARLDPDARPLRPDTDRRDPVPVSETPAGDVQSEGFGDGDTAAGPPPDMKPAVRRAGASFEKVEAEQPDLSPPANSAVRYTERQWSYIRDHYDEIYPPDASGRTTMPAFETWGRYVREYLRLTEGPKNSPRGGRPLGRSVVKQKDLDQSRRDADD